MFEFYCSIYFSLLFLCVLAIVVLRNTDLSRESLLDILAADMAAAVILSANIWRMSCLALALSVVFMFTTYGTCTVTSIVKLQLIELREIVLIFVVLLLLLMLVL